MSPYIRLAPLLAPRVSSMVSRRIWNLALAWFSKDFEPYDDEVLPALIEEMLFDPVFDARLYAAFLIYLSPYRESVAGALLQEVSTNRHIADVAWLTTLFEALRVLGGQPERARVEKYVLASGISDAINDAASYAMGHIGGTSTDSFWLQAIRQYTNAWQCSSHQRSISILDRLAYAIGIADNRPLLMQVVTDPNIPNEVRQSAQWWLAQPSFITQSARS